jgi:transcriptional regulator with XRE-family HTH domain
MVKRSQVRRRADVVDLHLGRKLRERRSMLGWTQAELGDGVGLTFQQINKYEAGRNRIGAGRLWQFTQLLNVPVSYFFEGLEGKDKRRPIPKFDARDALLQREKVNLVRNYYAITNEKLRNRIRQLVKTMAEG